MHITWITSGTISWQDGKLYSPMASIRYRVLVAAEQLAQQGHQIDLVCGPVDVSRSDLNGPLRCDVALISKGLFAGSVDLAERAKSLGARLLVDLCDDHFDTAFRDTYFSLCRLADDLVASTPQMADVIRLRTGRRAEVIGDPYEAPAAEARFTPGERTRLLWFGHPTNFDTISDMLPSLIALSKERQLELHVVSERCGNIDTVLADVAKRHAPAMTTRFTPWSQAATWQALADCDIVVVPSLSSATKLVKSPNRLVEAIRSGRFVAAFPLPSYLPFAEYAWLGKDVTAGVQWALAHPRAVVERIHAGQYYIERQFSPGIIVPRWQAVIERAHASRASA